MEDIRKDRKTLKEYFQSGKVPTEGQFAELIDSTHNIIEDGPVRFGDKGWMICPIKGKEPGIGFYSKENCNETEPPIWLLTATPDGNLLLKNKQEETMLSVSQDMTFTLFNQLTVKGNVTANSFKDASGIWPGQTLSMEIPADRKWYNLPIEAAAGECRPGCRVYRIWACYQNIFSEDYQMTEALVQHCNYGNKTIKSSRKHWWGWSGKIRMRWRVREGKLYLQICSKHTDLRNGIHCQIARVWSYTETEANNM